jgi:[DsrC]-trisulfide reductase subunit J
MARTDTRPGGVARRAARLVALIALACAASVVRADGADASRVPLPHPAIPASAGTKCVRDTEFMRRNHYELLLHHRTLTVHEGIRTKQDSLANCVNCHAGKGGRVTGSKDAFCVSCHAYAAVKIDCFECHSDRPAPSVASLLKPDPLRQAASLASLAPAAPVVEGAR